jgi:hypothetical protein
MLKFFAELRGAPIKTSEGPRNFLLPICIGKPHEAQKGDLLKVTLETLSTKVPGIIYIVIVDSLYRFLPSHPSESEDAARTRFEMAGIQWLRENLSIINELNRLHKQKMPTSTTPPAFSVNSHMDDLAIEQGPIVVINWNAFLTHPEYRSCEALIKEAFGKNAQDNPFAKEVLFEALPHTGERVKSWSRSSYTLEKEHQRDVNYLLEEAAVWLIWSLPKSNIHHVVHFQKGLSQTLNATNNHILSSDRSFHAPEYLQVKPKQQAAHQPPKRKAGIAKVEAKPSSNSLFTPATSLSSKALQALTEQHRLILQALLLQGKLDESEAIRVASQLLTSTLETIDKVRKESSPSPPSETEDPSSRQAQPYK